MQTMIRFLFVLAACYPISVKPVIAQSIPANQLMISPATATISFLWQGDSVNTMWEPNAAMLIPIKLQHCSRTFYMQFDLGAPYSLLYKNKIDAIRKRYPKAFPLKINEGKVKDFVFKSGKASITAPEIAVKQFDSSNIDWMMKNGIEIIGTIGADFIDGKISIIDYPRQKLTISDSIPEKLLPHLSLTDFIYTGRRVLLPATIQNKKTLLYFDTGSSMFELLTNKETCHQLAAPDAKRTQNKVHSWGRLLTANTLASNDRITLANISIPIHSSTYIEGVNDTQVAQMSGMGIGGMTGNKLFLCYILVLDTKNKKFGLASLPE
jgi:hypothetical protein